MINQATDHQREEHAYISEMTNRFDCSSHEVGVAVCEKSQECSEGAQASCNQQRCHMHLSLVMVFVR